MRWDQALKLMWLLQRDASVARGPAGISRLGRARAASICVVSGKGGTGKSVVSASLGTLLASRGRTLLVDADMGVGNAHILQDVSPARSFVDVVQGTCQVREAIVPCRESLDLVSAGSGVSRMAGLSPYELHLIAAGLEAIEGDYRFVVVDSAAGISEQTIAFAAASDLVLVVTTPDLTAMTDAYAFIKVLLARRRETMPWLLVNRVTADAPAALHAGGSNGSPAEDSGAEGIAAAVAERIAGVCLKFLGRQPQYLGCLPEDRAVAHSVATRRPVVVSDPGSPAAVAIQSLTVPLLGELESLPSRGLGLSLRRGIGFAAATA